MTLYKLSHIKNINKTHLITILLLGALYYTTGPGAILGSNDGAQFALVRTYAAHRSFDLKDKLAYTNYVNLSKYKNTFYSDRLPGLNIVSAPLYALGLFFNTLSNTPQDPQKFENIQSINPLIIQRQYPVTSVLILFMLISPALTGAWGAYLVWKIARVIGGSRWGSIAAAAAFGLGSLQWKYATLYFSHSLSTLLILAAVYLILDAIYIKKGLSSTSALLIGLASGLAILTEYFNIVFLIPVYIYALMRVKLLIPSNKSVRNIIVLCIAFLIPTGMALIYQYVLFENPLKTTYAYHHFYLWARTIKGFFSGNFIQGLIGQLFSFGLRRGVFILSPILFLLPIACYKMYFKKPAETILFLSIFFFSVGIYAFAREWNGGGYDTRYLLAGTSFLFIILSYLPFHNKLFKIVAIFLLFISIIHAGIFTYETAKTGFSPWLNIYHLPYYLFTASIIYWVLYHKKSLKFLGIILASACALIINIRMDWRVNEWKYLVNDNLESGKWTSSISYKRNMSYVGNIIYPKDMGSEGIIDTSFNLQRTPRYVVIAPYITIGSKNSYIRIELVHPHLTTRLASFHSEKERGWRPFLVLNKKDLSRKLRIRYEVYVDDAYAVTPGDARIEYLSVAAVY